MLQMTEAAWGVTTDIKTNNMREKKQKPKGPVQKKEAKLHISKYVKSNRKSNKTQQIF